jgi:hypothetical protein
VEGPYVYRLAIGRMRGWRKRRREMRAAQLAARGGATGIESDPG